MYPRRKVNNEIQEYVSDNFRYEGGELIIQTIKNGTDTPTSILILFSPINYPAIVVPPLMETPIYRKKTFRHFW